MSELKTNLQNILQEKEDKIIPGNIKKDIQIFDIIGTYEGSGGDSPLTEEEYNEIVATLKTYIPLEENIVDDNTRCLFHCEDYSNTILIEDDLSHSLTGVNIVPNGKFNSAIEITNGNYNVTYTNSTIINYINSGADYTLDFWLNVPETLTHDWGAVASISDNHTSHGNFFLHCFQNTGANTYKLKLYAKNADFDEEKLEVDLNYNVYNHIAVVKQDYNYSLFANGVKIGTVEWTTSYNSNTRIIFGSLDAVDSYYIHEYIDEIRFSDVARYTDSFNVPNTPYGQAVTDNRTLTELIEDLEEEKQLKVLPTNIRNQITILGVTGNLIPGIDTSDANAIASDIVQDKTAYVNGEKLTGALTMFNYSFGDLAEQGYDLSGKSEEDPFVLTVDENGLNIAPKMPDRLSLESGSYFPVGVSNLDIAEEANITSDKIVQGNTIFGVVGTGGSTEYESLSNIGTSVNNESLLPESQFVTLSGTVNNTGIVTEDVTHFVAGTSYSSLANTIGLTADKLVEGNTVLGIAGTAEIGVDINDYINPVFAGGVTASNKNGVSQLITRLPVVDMINTNSMSYFFHGCTSLVTIDQIINTQNITDMSHAFSGCSKLTAIPEFSTINLTKWYYTFYNCSSLVTVPMLSTRNISTINNPFSGCTSLSNESLNNILRMCINATSYTGTKTLERVGLTEDQATICETLSNYQAFLDAGWTTGY